MSLSVVEAIRARRSVKQFSAEPVHRETLLGLLELAMLAPNHRMTQPCGFVVLGPEARRAYGEVKGDRRARAVGDGAVAESVRRNTVESMETLPAAVVFTQRLAEDAAVREEDFATVYMGIQNFLLGAVALGLGTHVKTGAILDAPETRNALGVPDSERVVALVHVGGPMVTPKPKARCGVAERTRWLP